MSHAETADGSRRYIAYKHLWCTGLEFLELSEGVADGTAIIFDEIPFHLTYHLKWDAGWHIREATLRCKTTSNDRSLHLVHDGRGQWSDGEGRRLADLDGCTDIDVWPTPFTNTFPIRRMRSENGKSERFQVAWVRAPELSVQSQTQAYTVLGNGLYLFESPGDEAIFRAKLTVDGDGFVLYYPELFQRIEFRHAGE